MASAVEASYKQQGWHTGVKSAQAPIHAATARCQLVRAAVKMQQCQGCVSQLNALEADDCAGRSCHVMPWYGAPKLSPCHGRVILSMCRTCALSCALLRDECHCCHHVHKQQMVLPAIRLACLMSSQPSLLPVAMVGRAQSAAWGPFKERGACDGVTCEHGVTPCARQLGRQLCAACVPLHACTPLPCDQQGTLCSLQLQCFGTSVQLANLHVVHSVRCTAGFALCCSRSYCAGQAGCSKSQLAHQCFACCTSSALPACAFGKSEKHLSGSHVTCRVRALVMMGLAAWPAWPWQGRKVATRTRKQTTRWATLAMVLVSLCVWMIAE